MIKSCHCGGNSKAPLQGSSESEKCTDSRLFVMVGNPNVGKTTLINAVSGASLRIGNWPGTTVERMETHFVYKYDGGDGCVGRSSSQNQNVQESNSSSTAKKDSHLISIHLVDLPGAYGLVASSAEEKVTRDELLTRLPDAVVDVIDAGNLERNLAMTIELIELGVPVVVALNLLDEAKEKGMKPNIEALSQALDLPVVPTVAVREEGVHELMQHAVQAKRSRLKIEYPKEIEEAIADLSSFLDTPAARWLSVSALVGDKLEDLDDPISDEDLEEGERAHQAIKIPSDFRKKAEYYRKKFADSGIDCFLEIADTRYRLARKFAELGQSAPAGVHKLTAAIDKVVLHPVFGIPIFLFCMLILFRFTFAFSDPWVEWLNVIKEVFMGWTASVDMPDMLRSFIMDGVLEGLGTVLAFTPVLFVLYIGMSVLESSGFLARSAFLVDRIMKAMNLPGKAFIPMLVGVGCNVPGIVATRTLESFNERLRVSMAVPFAPCSARMAVFAFFAAIFFPRNPSYALFFIYTVSILMGLFTILLMSKILHSDETGSIMELPPYRLPTFKVILKQAWARTLSFLEGAGGAIFIAVILVWIIDSFPIGSSDSYFAKLSRLCTLFTSTFGITDWHLAGALVPGFVAKEVVVGSMAVSYFGAGAEVASITLGSGLEHIAVSFMEAVINTGKAVFQLFGFSNFGGGSDEGPAGLAAKLLNSASPRAILAYMIYVLLYMPCVGTLSALKTEFGWKWTWFSIAYSLVAAWILAVIVYHLPLGDFLASL
ncbi:MAG: ferrous iron transport protein B [Candidatus Bruticola sp.]